MDDDGEEEPFIPTTFGRCVLDGFPWQTNGGPNDSLTAWPSAGRSIDRRHTHKRNRMRSNQMK